jgi:alpha-mannosidase
MLKNIAATILALSVLGLPALAQEPKEDPAAAIDYLKNGEVKILQLSHHDLGWHRGSYEGEMKSSNHEINTALKLLAKDSKFKYDGECTVWLFDYLKHHPDRAEEFGKLIKQGRIQWGAGYAMPYTSLVTGEQLARLMYLGRRWYKNKFGVDTKLWYNTDVPGFTIQMPQILSKAGADKAYLARSWNIDGVRTDFLNWSSPDGSSVFCYFMNHYADNISWRPGSPNIANDPAKMSKWIADQDAEYKTRKIKPIMPHLISKDCVPPRDLRELIDNWNKYATEKKLPPMEYGTFADMMDEVKSSPGAKFKHLQGEWPNKWLYEGAPANYKMFSDQRAASRLLCAAEAFGAFRAVTEGTWEKYPTEKLFEGWRNVDFSCHGMAPDKCIATFLQKYASAKASGQKMLDKSLGAIAAAVKTSAKSDNTPIVVFNTLSWTRTDIVKIPLPETQSDYRVYDRDDKQVPCQSTIDNKMIFLAKDIPSMGYSTFYLHRFGKPLAPGKGLAKPGAAWSGPFENDFFRITPGKQGIAAIFDKKLKRQLLKTDKFEAAQWLDFVYKGQGAGEHVHIRLPEAAPLDKLGVFATTWACKASGPLFTTFESKEVATPRGKVSFQLTLFNELKRIDLTCTMRECDETEARQIRLAFPINANFKNVAYEVPFGKVEIGADEIQPQLAFEVKLTKEQIAEFEKLRSTDLEKWKQWRRSRRGKTPVRPREIQNWIYAGDGEVGVTIGSSAIAWDYMDASSAPVDYPVLQPVLLCSAYSCSRWKHCWTQPGDHTFTFSIYSHQGGWRNGYRRGVATNNPLMPIAVKPNPSGKLPTTKSFLSVSADNVIVTAVKKSEDSNDIAVRFYEAEGKDKTKVVITPSFGVKAAHKTNLIEEDPAKMPHTTKDATLEVGKYSIETIRLVPEK